MSRLRVNGGELLWNFMLTFEDLSFGLCGRTLRVEVTGFTTPESVGDERQTDRYVLPEQDY